MGKSLSRKPSLPRDIVAILVDMLFDELVFHVMKTIISGNLEGLKLLNSMPNLMNRIKEHKIREKIVNAIYQYDRVEFLEILDWIHDDEFDEILHNLNAKKFNDYLCSRGQISILKYKWTMLLGIGTYKEIRDYYSLLLKLGKVDEVINLGHLSYRMYDEKKSDEKFNIACWLYSKGYSWAQLAREGYLYGISKTEWIVIISCHRFKFDVELFDEYSLIIDIVVEDPTFIEKIGWAIAVDKWCLILHDIMKSDGENLEGFEKIEKIDYMLSLNFRGDVEERDYCTVLEKSLGYDYIYDLEGINTITYQLIEKLGSLPIEWGLYRYHQIEKLLLRNDDLIVFDIFCRKLNYRSSLENDPMYALRLCYQYNKNHSRASKISTKVIEMFNLEDKKIDIWLDYKLSEVYLNAKTCTQTTSS